MSNILNYEMIFAAGLFLSLLLLMLGGLLNTVKRMSERAEKIWAAVILFLVVSSGGGMATIYGLLGDKLDLAHLEAKKTGISRDRLLAECPDMKTIVCQEKWYRYRADSLKLELKVMDNEKTKL
jgi:hypothetical protein